MQAATTLLLSPGSAKLVLRRYGLTVVLVGGALLATLLLQRFFLYPFLFLFFGAVMASAWFSGRIAGMVAVLLSILAVDYFFLPPLWSFAVNPAAGTYFAGFVLCAVVASWVSALKRQSEEALRQARDQLEVRISERTAALMKTETELARVYRMLSMSELTASIAHEIKQPLTAVVANGQACLEWLSAKPPNLDKARQSTERIIQDGTRASSVIDRVRAFFQKELPAKDWLDVNEVIQELMALLRAQAQAVDVTLRTELALNLPKLKGDRIQLQQVMLNLMMNGIDAMNRSAVAGRRELVVRSSKRGANEIEVCVEDCGPGLSAEIADKIFDPFFTTKPHGIGMGLSISRSIIESHEGRLWATDRPGGGTIFQFVVPVRSEQYG